MYYKLSSGACFVCSFALRDQYLEEITPLPLRRKHLHVKLESRFFLELCELRFKFCGVKKYKLGSGNFSINLFVRKESDYFSCYFVIKIIKRMNILFLALSSGMPNRFFSVPFVLSYNTVLPFLM